MKKIISMIILSFSLSIYANEDIVKTDKYGCAPDHIEGGIELRPIEILTSSDGSKHIKEHHVSYTDAKSVILPVDGSSHKFKEGQVKVSANYEGEDIRVEEEWIIDEELARALPGQKLGETVVVSTLISINDPNIKLVNKVLTKDKVLMLTRSTCELFNH
jgi:hypothetical protein